MDPASAVHGPDAVSRGSLLELGVSGFSCFSGSLSSRQLAPLLPTSIEAWPMEGRQIGPMGWDSRLVYGKPHDLHLGANDQGDHGA